MFFFRQLFIIFIFIWSEKTMILLLSASPSLYLYLQSYLFTVKNNNKLLVVK